MPTKTRVGLVDSHPVVHSGVYAKIMEQRDMELCFHLTDVEFLLLEAAAKKPCVIVAELHLAPVKGELSSADGTQIPTLLSTHDLEIPVIHFSGDTDPVRINRARLLKSAGFVPKTAEVNELLKAIDAIAGGKELWPDRLPSEAVMTPVMHDGPRLTPREMQVLQLIAQGLDNKEAGKVLGISIETVKEHVQNLLRKTNHRDRTQLAVWYWTIYKKNAA